MTPERIAFVEERKTGIGGSDVHHLFNLPPYGCARQLWYDKIDAPPDHPKPDTGAMKRGRALEPIVLDMYRQDHPEVTLESRPLNRFPGEDEWAIVHVDAFISDGVGRVVEVKCPGPEMFRKIKREGLPDAYLLQGQHGMFVTEAHECLYIVMDVVNWQYLSFVIARDNHVIAEIRQAGRRLWHMIQTGQVPAKLEDPASPQCGKCPWRTTCRGEELLAMVAAETHVDEIPMMPEFAGLIEEYQEAQQLASEAEQNRKDVADRVKTAIGTLQAFDVPGYRAYCRATEVRRKDADALVGLYAAMRIKFWDQLVAELGLEATEKYYPRPDQLVKISAQRSLRVYAR